MTPAPTRRTASHSEPRDPQQRPGPSITLLCDGVVVYECTTDQQVIDLVRGGQGVLIAIGQVRTDVQARPTSSNPWS